MAPLSTGRRAGGPQTRPREERPPVQVICDELPEAGRAQDDEGGFLQEAGVGEAQRAEFLARLERFFVTDENDEPVLMLSHWLNFNAQYKLSKRDFAERFFRAVDRDSTGRVTLPQLFMGCVAANPGTPHILNSQTGFQRARYFFNYYDEDRTGFLNFEQVCAMIQDTRADGDRDPDSILEAAVNFAQEFGQLALVTVLVDGAAGGALPAERLCEFRASRHWSARRTCQEIGFRLGVGAEGLELSAGGRPLAAGEPLEWLIGAGEGPAAITVSAAELQAAQPQTLWSADVAGLEKLVHVPFDSVWQALSSERLRGTSRLFRFQRVAYHPQAGRAAVGGA